MTKLLGKVRITPTTYIKNISVDVPKKSIKNKISDECFMIPDIFEYNYMLEHNFKITQLKKISKTCSNLCSVKWSPSKTCKFLLTKADHIIYHHKLIGAFVLNAFQK